MKQPMTAAEYLHSVKGKGLSDEQKLEGYLLHAIEPTVVEVGKILQEENSFALAGMVMTIQRTIMNYLPEQSASHLINLIATNLRKNEKSNNNNPSNSDISDSFVSADGGIESPE